MAHRIGGVLAIGLQIGERPIAVDPLVHPVSLDQPQERLRRDIEAADRLLKGDESWLLRVAIEAAPQLRLPVVQERQAVALGLVPQVIHAAAIGVHGVDVGAQGAWKQPRGYCEVLVVARCEALAVSVRLRQRASLRWPLSYHGPPSLQGYDRLYPHWLPYGWLRCEPLRPREEADAGYVGGMMKIDNARMKAVIRQPLRRLRPKIRSRPAILRPPTRLLAQILDADTERSIEFHC